MSYISWDSESKLVRFASNRGPNNQRMVSTPLKIILTRNLVVHRRNWKTNHSIGKKHGKWEAYQGKLSSHELDLELWCIVWLWTRSAFDSSPNSRNMRSQTHHISCQSSLDALACPRWSIIFSDAMVRTRPYQPLLSPIVGRRLSAVNSSSSSTRSHPR